MSRLFEGSRSVPVVGSGGTIWIDKNILKLVRNLEQVLDYLQLLADNLTSDIFLRYRPYPRGIEVLENGERTLLFIMELPEPPKVKSFYIAYPAEGEILENILTALPFLAWGDASHPVMIGRAVNPEEHVEKLEIYLPYLLGWRGAALLEAVPEEHNILLYLPESGLYKASTTYLNHLAYPCGIWRRILNRNLTAPIYILIPGLVEAYRRLKERLDIEELARQIEGTEILAAPLKIGEYFYPRNIIEQAETIINQLREKPVETLKRAVATRRSRQVEQYRENNKIITRTVIRHIPLYRLGEETYLLPLPPPTKIIERGDKTIVKYYPPNTGLILKPTRQLTIREILDLI